ncbi:MAG: PQQ-like beta-propeller repeat protein, partial [Planctomycetales bacterium]|nr:PQQ-like beta-propeller repeat protein [Planctomycetales bacterium]
NWILRLPTALVVVLSMVPAMAEDWHQWRGNNRDGKSAETGLLKQWPEGGPHLLWQANGLGNGYSTPTAAGGRVFLLRNKDLNNEEVIALSLADGSQQWATKIGRVGENSGPQYPGARSTPTIDGKRLYALGSDGDLACLDIATGAIHWSKNLKTDFGGKPGKWAYAESPLIDGEVLVCSPGGEQATVVALNKQDGSVLWRAPIPEGDDASFSSPIAATIQGVKQYVVFLSKGVVGLDAQSGQPLWRYTKTADKDANVPTPVVKDNFVYTAASRVGGGLVQISSDQLAAKEIYFGKSLPAGMGGSILLDGYLYGSAGATLMCVDFATGEVQWQDRSIGAGSLCFADGKLFLHGENNEVAMISASPAGYQELSRFSPPNAPDHGKAKAWSYPIIVDGKLIFRDVGSVWCYDIRS